MARSSAFAENTCKFMKKTVLTIIAFAIIQIVNANPSKGYKITGNVENIPDGTKLYLQLVGPPDIEIDSTTINHGKFTFKGASIKTPKWALIKMKGHFVAVCDFYLENGNITITGKEFGAIARGTETNEQYLIYNRDINSMFNQIYRLSLAYSQTATDSIKNLQEACKQELLNKEITFVKTYPASPVSLRIVEFICRQATSKEINTYINYLSASNQNMPQISALRDQAIRQQRTENGAIAPDFTLPSQDNHNISLSDFKGKYVLLDFWASWCAPCRASFPAMGKLFTQYKDKNFTILGISLDRKNDAWQKALKEENCSWQQVADFKGIVAKKYAVLTIPLLVLVGPDGKIIGRYDKSTIAEELERLF